MEMNINLKTKKPRFSAGLFNITIANN